MDIKIRKKHLCIYLCIIFVFNSFYVFLFVINRLQYVDVAFVELQHSLEREISNQVRLNNFFTKKNLEYFFDVAQFLEELCRRDKKACESFVRDNRFYSFFALLNKEGRFRVTNSNDTSFHTLIESASIIEKKTPEAMFIFDSSHGRTYLALMYPMQIAGEMYSYIVAYVDTTELLDFKNIYFVGHKGALINMADDILVEYRNISYEYPDEWNKIISSKYGQFINDNGIFTYHVLKYDFDIAGTYIDMEKNYLVSIIPANPNDNPYIINNVKSFLRYADFHTNIEYWIIAWIWIFLTSIVCWMVIINIMQRSESAQFDNLTGVYNRMAGYARIEYIATDIFSTSFKKYILHRIVFGKSIHAIHFCMVDIDGLKQVNDTLGHKYGDELIVSAVRILKQKLRKHEFIVRMGGDEFLIVFLNRDSESIERYWNLVHREFSEKNAEANLKYIIKVSHGTVQYNQNDNINTCIAKADEIMYKAKRANKVNLFFN